MKTNVLVFPAGENNSVELHEALSHNVNIEVFGASSVDRHGPYIFKNYRSGLPFIRDDDFIEKFNALVDEWKIDLVFPTHDTVALFFARNKDNLHAKIIVADLETAEVCRDKRKTYDLFADCDFCPKLYHSFESFPCFVKPVDGQGGQNAYRISRKEDIPEIFDNDKNVIVEYLPGDEYTVDCISDRHGELKAILPRKRNRMMAGICVAGYTMPADKEIIRIAEAINQRLSFLGLWYFQLKKDGYGAYKLLEVSCRCAGTMCLSRARGVNLPLLSVYAALGKDISVFENPYTVSLDRVLIARYKTDYHYDTVYVDYDDTVVEKDDVCLPVIRFLYQCKNQKKKVVLISRHEADHDDTLEESLNAHFISKTLFDEIIKLSFDESKADFINGVKSIFIDNAYAERKKVHDKLGIPVFDVEGIEVLTDWRT